MFFVMFCSCVCLCLVVFRGRGTPDGIPMTNDFDNPSGWGGGYDARWPARWRRGQAKPVARGAGNEVKLSSVLLAIG